MSEAAQGTEKVSVEDVLETLGARSFGPMLLLAGLVTLAPLIGDIPGMPTIMGTVVLLTSVQLLFGRKHVWLPRWVLSRAVTSHKLEKAVSWLKRPARFIDRMMHPRMPMLVSGAGVYVIALVCAAIALMTPAMELIPFSANIAGLAWTTFGLALIARDGLVAAIALLFAMGAATLIGLQLA